MAERAPWRDPLLALRVAMLAVLVSLAVRTETDPDLWGHVKYGALIVTTGSVPRTDPYSFTSDHPWVNHEWLSEVAMFGAYRAAGARGLIALRLGLIAVILWIAARAVRGTRAVPIVHDLALAVVVLGMYAQTATVRPQLFSVMLFALMLSLLEAGYGRARWWLCVPLLFVAWVNLHGGWLVGMGVLAIWAIAETILGLRAGRVGWLPIAVLLASLAATLVNPYGTAMLTFLQDTVGVTRTDIQEWQTAFALGPAHVAHWAFVGVFVVFVVLRSPRPLTLHQWLILLVLGGMSLQMTRVLVFFAVGSVLLLAPQLNALAAARRRTAPAPVPFGFTLACWAVAIAAVGWAVPFASHRLQCIAMTAEHVPEPDVASIVATEHLHGRMVTFFDWGQYAIWHFYPAIRVSYDGRRETVYSKRVRDLHDQLYEGTPEGRSYLASLEADLAWLPAHLPAVAMLREAGWSERFRGPKSVLLTRQPSPLPPATPRESSGPRCFPDP
jgi:hypothetical protein